jgi:hypothetical protein
LAGSRHRDRQPGKGILDLLEGQYKNPVRVVAFNTAEKWSQDVSSDVVQELRHRCDLQLRDVPFFLEEFVERYEGRYHDVSNTEPSLSKASCGIHSLKASGRICDAFPYEHQIIS